MVAARIDSYTLTRIEKCFRMKVIIDTIRDYFKEPHAALSFHFAVVEVYRNIMGHFIAKINFLVC